MFSFLFYFIFRSLGKSCKTHPNELTCSSKGYTAGKCGQNCVGKMNQSKTAALTQFSKTLNMQVKSVPRLIEYTQAHERRDHASVAFAFRAQSILRHWDLDALKNADGRMQLILKKSVRFTEMSQDCKTGALKRWGRQDSSIALYPVLHPGPGFSPWHLRVETFLPQTYRNLGLKSALTRHN